MGLDYAFWKAGEGSREEIYADLGEGESGRLTESDDVLKFRHGLLASWPELEDSIEPYEEDPDFDAADLAKYVVINIHANEVSRIENVWALAEQYGLVAYDPLHKDG
ncbi:hypothetical protein [Nonomuraea sediminis]|uniref:hypothetical protein n=1 Tax=Nonomuraea sediminis TaxID=2835864 RepID=UPI001BDC839F|nr:hypothetical protein [Nonomuraea sediminis]